MPRQVSHERARLGEVALALLLVAALLAAFALAGTSDYESMRACEGARETMEAMTWRSR
nr:hypothetical protein [uncultured Olsenella sp.]